ncbi:MAG: hypothetical protein WHT26_04090 [Thermus sp.]|uniref:hypothetical protein n=1 Tax=Thermus TaxID=270 RepID=UPI00037FED8B|nr:hypothetical protein [Thermus oshimai]
MRALALLALFLSACTLTLEIAPGPVLGLSTQATYCQDRPTRLDYRLFLEGRVDRLEFFWVPEGVHPSRARPEETWALTGPFWGPEVAGYLEAAPTGEIWAVYLVPQGIRVDPLPTRRLWARGAVDGVLGPYVRAQDPVRPEASPSCDPGW